MSSPGRATVVLHGFTGSAAAMAPLVCRLPEPVMALDLPGHGPGPVSDEPRHYTMAAAVAGVHAATAELGPIAVVGYSMGARTALHFALTHPERVTALALIGVRPGFDDPAQRATRLAADQALAHRIETEGIEWFVDYWSSLPLFATQRDRLSAQDQAAIRAQRLTCDPKGLAHSLRGMGAAATEPITHRLSQLTMPCGLIAGADDTKFMAIAHQIAPLIPQASVHPITLAGHAPHLEAPTPTTTAIIQCLSR